MMINSIKKGKKFEREIAKLLSEKTGVKWMRVPLSGGFASVNESEDSRFDGDVFTEDERYHNIVVECKSNKTLEVNDLFNRKSKFWSWIKQAEKESRGKDWMLFIKINRKGTYLVFDTEKSRIHMGSEEGLMIENYNMVKLS